MNWVENAQKLQLEKSGSKLEKNPAKLKLGTKNVLYNTSCPFLWSSKVLEFAIFG